MIGKIYISGRIGSTEEVSGVELQDVVSQVEAKKLATVLHIYINSEGGSVRTGKLIAEYIKGLPNAITIADGFCASMGTEIHLSRPVEQRKIISGTQYMIHCPALNDFSGNSEELAEAAEYIKKTELSMLNMYHKATGLDKTALSGLMKQTTKMTDEQTVAFGFCSEIITPMELKAVAFVDKEIININKNEEIMSEKNKTFKEKVLAFLKEEDTVTAMIVVTDNGELSYASEGDLPTVGEEVTLDGQDAPDGVYTTEAGFAITVSGGVVSEIVEPAETDVEAMAAQIADLTAQIEAANALATEKETALAEKETALAESEAKFADLEDKAVAIAVAEIKSKYKPEARVIKPAAVVAELSMKEKLAARKSELKK